MADIPDYSVQPVPLKVEGAVSVHDLVIEDLRALFQAGSSTLGVAELGVSNRKDYGLVKYGTVLHVNNGRDYLADADDEAGDLVAYLKAYMLKYPDMAEACGLEQDYRWALLIMAKLRAIITDRQADEAFP